MALNDTAVGENNEKLRLFNHFWHFCHDISEMAGDPT